MTINERAMWILAKDVPVEPKFYPGKYGHKYDSYACGRCGFGIITVYKFCPNCGQRITDNYLGRRKTKDEQAKYHQMTVFDIIADTTHGGHTSAIRACDLMELEWEADK